MKVLHKFKNGNVNITLLSDGTRIQQWEDDETPYYEFPLSMDIKITNKCDLKCGFCHEMSVPNGEHADLQFLLEILDGLPAGTELALGGGNPLEHSSLPQFLKACKTRGYVPSMTVNGKHIFKYKDVINNLIDNELIYGLGISIEDDFDFTLLEYINNSKNVVLHVIAGVNNVNILDKIIKYSTVKKVLILGYKTVGRGIKFHSQKIEDSLLAWKEELVKYKSKLQLCFDNLAVSQLDVHKLVTPEQWDLLYQGKDGTSTLYIDAVKKQFAVSSTSVEKWNIDNNIKGIFEKVKQCG